MGQVDAPNSVSALLTEDELCPLGAVGQQAEEA